MSDVDSQKSTISYVFMLGSGAISWASRLQKIVPYLRRRLNMLQRQKLAMIWLNDFMKKLVKEQVSLLLYNDS